jgi:NAD(P)-dependent dehydrogenase (short-subunit alcohol dehydrogenase family)
MNNSDLFEKNILITGATSGIGKQIAISCIANGAKVIFCGRSKEKLAELRGLYGDNHIFIESDISTDEGILQITKRCPTLDGLVHCAGILKTTPVIFINRHELENIMNINFTASALITTSLLKEKKINRNSSIVFISSITSNYSAMKGNAMYSATKGAMNAFAKVLALELSSKRIRVNTINPGMIITNLWQNEMSELSSEQILEDEKKYPLGYGESKDVAEATIFLLSQKSKWITGSNVILDGGFTIQ